ncbi:gluconate 2-dehydrogenase subunit 3 family protein [Sphingobacterium bovistauri]|uniref:Gluconate 2-dehydrogenase subunit 3 family protein n=1 Tax=Sphingobacterium bovistauri TaxID=2781959 RepID=A0ABS7Z2B0_9SPHI|nr:gluconate 2-dehydrogenase subunit 3 family protein [Sphingobacterium bovistauri]MCA5004303.1 gluconate 2-dehydrogenase subunit 3 family protein [Sphingobacterium bovistauri]
MKRRTAIKQLFILAGGIAIATACDSGRNKASIALSNVDFTKDDEELLAQLVESIIPETDSPGARSLKLHLFVMKMVDDCHSSEDQQAFIEGLKKSKTIKGKPLAEVQNYLTSLEKEDKFLDILKRRTLMGYQNSEYVMKNKVIYELVPGRYDGAVKISS